MIKGFMTENELMNYYNTLSLEERNRFIYELMSFTNYANYMFLYNKAMIISKIYEHIDERQIISEIEKIAKDSMKLKNVKIINKGFSYNYPKSNVVDIYNNYLEIIYKSTLFFNEIYSISSMFNSMAFNGSFYPETEGVITGVYNGVHKGYSRNELMSKYTNIILNINSTFNNEWISLKKFDLYKLQ